MQPHASTAGEVAFSSLPRPTEERARRAAQTTRGVRLEGPGRRQDQEATSTCWCSSETPPDAERNARELIYGGDDPDDIDHSVVVQTDADWLRDLEKELPFPRNVEAEGVQIHPVYQPASRPPGDRPPVTRKGIRHAVPVWLQKALSNLKALAYEIEELKAGRFKLPGMAVRRAFDAVFFSAMAWCLTRGVSVVRRKDLPASVERHLIEPGVLDPGWQDRIRMLWAAWTAEFDWRHIAPALHAQRMQTACAAMLSARAAACFLHAKRHLLHSPCLRTAASCQRRDFVFLRRAFAVQTC